MNESRYIRLFSGIHGSTPYLADAEIMARPDGFALFSIDSFSEEEDFFRNTPPGIIGHNMAAAVCSDLLACGVRPELLLQAWNIDESRGEDYYRRIADGIEEVLRHYRAFSPGGDTGSAKQWNYTAAAIAHSASAPVRRRTSRRVPFDLYLSGGLGTTNLAVFLGSPLPEIPLREPVPPDALFGTDTSGGFFDALENFRRVNRGMRLCIDLERVLAPELRTQCPPGISSAYFTLIGGAGEYELLFAVEQGTELPGMIRIGEGDFRKDDDPRNEVTFLEGETPLGNMKSPPPDYREIPPERYLQETGNYFKEVLEE